MDRTTSDADGHSRGRRRRDHRGSVRAWLARTAATTTGRLGLLAGAVLVVWFLPLLGGLAAGTFDNVGDAAWSGVRHLLDPGALGDDEGTGERIVGLIQVVAGIVLLVGALFAILGEVVERSLEGLSQVNPPVRARDHVIVVGQGELLSTVAGFVAERTTDPPVKHLVLLLPDRAERPDDLPSGCRIDVHAGDARRPDVLAAVSATEARAIIVLSPSGVDDETADVGSLEIAAALAAVLEDAPGPRPHVAVQVRRMRRMWAVWQQQIPPDIDPVPDDRGVGVPLALAVEHPAFVEMLAGVAGTPGSDTPYAMAADPLAGRSFGEAVAEIPGGLAIGLLRDGRARVVPAPSTPLQRGDRLVVMPFGASPDSAAGGGRDGSPRPVLIDAGAGPARVLVVGWSPIGRGLLRELRPETQAYVVVGRAGAKPDAAPHDVRIVDDLTDPEELAGVLEEVEPEAVVVVAGAGGEETEEGADARAAITALSLCQIAGDRSFPVVVEQERADHAARLREFDERIHVVSAQEITANALWLSALDRRRLEAMQAIGTDPRVSLEVRHVGGEHPVRLADAHRMLLEEGIGILAHARDGHAFTAIGPNDDMLPGDDVLVLVRRDA